MFVVACCALFVACWVVHVACCVLHVVWWFLLVVVAGLVSLLVLFLLTWLRLALPLSKSQHEPFALSQAGISPLKKYEA